MPKTSSASLPNSGAAGCDNKHIFRENMTGITAPRPQLRKLIKALARGNVVFTPAVDRLSRDTTDLGVIAREMQHAGEGTRSLAEPFPDTSSDFAEINFAISREGTPPHSRTHRAAGPTPTEKDVKFGRKPILTPHRQQAARARLDTTQHRPQPRCRSEHYWEPAE